MIKSGTPVEVKTKSGKTIQGVVECYDEEWGDYSVVYTDGNGDEDWDWFHEDEVTTL